ncbi:MAG TPA: haloacid dehalogenase-like hydrolase [Capillimicrobium sp.]|nr:haloacid dehalogenase-like hydrolase [Capillimicrobium sp.]
MADRLLLLFDIDGTLLDRATAEHAAALHEAMHQVYGVDTTSTRVPAAGRTDLEIARETLLVLGLSAARIEEGFADLRAAAAEAYARLVPDDLSTTVMPGMRDLLERLAARDDAILSLVTGNLEAIARLKLNAAGLGGFFASGQGGFGSDSVDRTDLPPIARRRAGTRERPHPRERTLVIGDTPLDIACARADGLAVLALATGPHPAADVADADAVLTDAHALGVELDRRLA